MTKSPTPGSRWRILTHGRGAAFLNLTSGEAPSVFDELVIDDWFHLEQMDGRRWWMAVSDGQGGRHVLRIRIDRNGKAHITHEVEKQK